ncbi:MAG: (2Fe-2S)-binding protein [Nitrososphaerales archaeon]|nr:(2Fe-2S)-binding protein [Nitrososphaerales archaeon]
MTKLAVKAEINGESRDALVEPRTLLVNFLREKMGLTGTHLGCETTNCGACTVLLDGRAVKSCTVLAVQVDGRRVTTIEGIGGVDELDPIQLAFWEKHGLQCGFCTPGMIMASYELLAQNPDPDEHEIRAALSGNLCRCTGYVNIIESVRYAAKLKRKGTRTPARTAAKPKGRGPTPSREVEGM